MSIKDFKNGMAAGAKPFDAKFDQMSKHFSDIANNIDANFNNINDTVNTVIDDIESIQKKQIFDLNTKVDIKEQLDDVEKELLASILITISNNGVANNEYQKKFVRSVLSYIGIIELQLGIDMSRIENIDNLSSQRAILQVIMEFLFLGYGNFNFEEDYDENLLEYFNVNKKGLREIKQCINSIYVATGFEGIAEKYGFVVDDVQEVGEVQSDILLTYDGSDICEVCADIVNINDYVVLKNYIAIKDNNYNVILISKMDGSKKSLNIKLIGMDKLYGSYNHLCIEKFREKQLIIINVENFDTTNIDLGDNISHCLCTEENLFFTIAERFRSELFQYNFEEKSNKLIKYIKDGENILQPKSFVVIKNDIYFNSINYSRNDSLWKFNYETEELEVLCSNDQFKETNRSSLEVYNNYIYAITDDNKGYVYVDLAKPNIMKSMKLPIDNSTDIEVIKFYGMIYYFKLNSNFPLYKYDMDTGESILIKDYTDCGMAGGNMYFITAPKPQIVGKWLYYTDGKNLELSKLCLL